MQSIGFNTWSHFVSAPPVAVTNAETSLQTNYAYTLENAAPFSRALKTKTKTAEISAHPHLYPPTDVRVGVLAVHTG